MNKLGTSQILMSMHSFVERDQWWNFYNESGGGGWNSRSKEYKLKWKSRSKSAGEDH